MADAPLSKDDLKLWLRIDGSDEDTILILLLNAATKKIEKAVTNDTTLYPVLQTDSRFKMAVMMVCAQQHESPTTIQNVMTAEIPDGIMGYIHELRCDYPCVGSDTL
jgi:uncharacterized phage protein (predicted DNA packaging)